MTKRWARYWHFATLLVSAASLVFQFHLALNGSLDTAPTRVIRYFSYFTIQSNFIVCFIAASLVLRADRDGPLWRVVRLDSVLCITVTGIVYVIVLRPLQHLSGLANVCDIGLHYVTPILALLGWLLFGPRPRFARPALGYATIFPVAWLAYTLIRGAFVHWYPYPFVDVDTHGYVRVAMNSVFVAALILALGAILVVLDRRLPAAPGRDD
jgi:hypothetical protein